MTPRFAVSSDGTRIGFTAAGDPEQPPILLIHGWAQQFICWRPLLDRLSDRFHIVAMDLRGHGTSDQPDSASAYTDTSLWGDDVQAVIKAAQIVSPVLVGWSYGSRVIAAYLATYGDRKIGGVALAGGILALGAHREDWMVGTASPGRDRDLYSEDLPRRLAATARFVDACTEQPIDRTFYGELVGANMLCPAFVRRALFGADVDLCPVYGDMTCPGLVIHGSADRVVAPAVGERAVQVMRWGRYVPYEGVGHAPFIEASDRFAEDLAGFVQSCLNDRRP